MDVLCKHVHRLHFLLKKTETCEFKDKGTLGDKTTETGSGGEVIFIHMEHYSKRPILLSS